jgi:acetolactate synthase-1/2/3 large subunit
VPAQIAVVGDIGQVLAQVATAVHERGAGLPPGGFADHPRTRRVEAELAEIEAEAGAIAAGDERPMHPLRVIQAIRATFPRETTVAIDVGCIAQHIAGGTPYFKVFEPRSLIVPSSFYGMGFAAGALPVARLVYPDRPAVAFVGDGSFQMVMNILPVAAEYRLPVTWCIFNDGALGSIRDIQQYRFDGRTLGTEFDVQPDFAKIAEACGCHGARVEDPADVDDALARALEANESGIPAVLDFAVSRARLLGTLEHYAFYPQELLEQHLRPASHSPG